MSIIGITSAGKTNSPIRNSPRGKRPMPHADGHRTIYTPQMIVSGRERIEGNNPGEVRRADRRTIWPMRGPVTLTLQREVGRLHDPAVADPPLHKGRCRCNWCAIPRRKRCDIERGENAGQDHHLPQHRYLLAGAGRMGRRNRRLDMQAQAVTAQQPWSVILQNEARRKFWRAARTRQLDASGFPAAVNPEPLVQMFAHQRLKAVVQGLGHRLRALPGGIGASTMISKSSPFSRADGIGRHQKRVVFQRQFCG